MQTKARVQEKSTSVSGMLFKRIFILKEIRTFRRGIIERIFYICTIMLVVSLCPLSSYAEILERVVAIVDDEVILLSELKEYRGSGKESDVSSDEVLINQMINRMLLLREARKFGLMQDGVQMKDDQGIVREYIQRRIKAFIHIPFDKIEIYYKDNLISYTDKEFYDVKDEIEEYLVSRELVKRLQKAVSELRQDAYIRIQLE